MPFVRGTEMIVFPDRKKAAEGEKLSQKGQRKWGRRSAESGPDARTSVVTRQPTARPCLLLPWLQ